MNVATFVKDSLGNSCTGWRILYFKSKVYPLLFFSRFFVKYAQVNAQVISVDLAVQDLESFLGELHMSFLGHNKIYWCKDISQLDSAQRRKFIAFVCSYQGPHRLMFFGNEAINFSKSSTARTVDLDGGVNQELYRELYQLFYPTCDNSVSDAFAQSLFAMQKTLSLDQACQMMQYNAALGDRDRETCTEWFDRIIEFDKSLFTLSQHLFAKNSTQFMELWKKTVDDFPPEFWIAFWSEQVWQAAIFLEQVFERGPVVARKSVNRLPFSFMQRDYKHYKERELIVAHNFLYGIDYGLKNGYASFGLELFFIHFLQGNFSRK